MAELEGAEVALEAAAGAAGAASGDYHVQAPESPQDADAGQSPSIKLDHDGPPCQEEPKTPKSPRPPSTAVSNATASPRGARGSRGGRGDGEQPFEDCYPPRREDEVRLLRRQRERHYQQELLRQIEAKRALKLQRGREEVRADLEQLRLTERNQEYLRRLHQEQQQQLQSQLQAQLRREEQREEQRMVQVSQTREQLREQFKDQQAEQGVRAEAENQDKQSVVDQLSEQLEKQHLPDDEAPENKAAAPASSTAGDGVRPAAEAAGAEQTPDLAAGVIDKVKLDDRRPWNHYRLLQKELGRRRHERAALQAARDAVAARRMEANAEARQDSEHRRYLDWRARVRRPGVATPSSPRLEAARRWAQSKRQQQLQQRASKDTRLAEWRRAKDEQERERRAAAAAAQMSAAQAAQEKQRRADDSFTRWLAAIHDRKLAERAGPAGVTGVTTYEAFYATPWNKILRERRKSTA